MSVVAVAVWTVSETHHCSFAIFSASSWLKLTALSSRSASVKTLRLNAEGVVWCTKNESLELSRSVLVLNCSIASLIISCMVVITFYIQIAKLDVVCLTAVWNGDWKGLKLGSDDSKHISLSCIFADSFNWKWKWDFVPRNGSSLEVCFSGIKLSFLGALNRGLTHYIQM